MPHLVPYVRSGSTIYASGQLAFDEKGLLPPTIEQQVRQCMANVEATLGQAGARWSDVVKTLVFLTDKRDYRIFDQIYGEVLGDHVPARSTVIAQLAIDGALIEIEVIAEISGR